MFSYTHLIFHMKPDLSFLRPMFVWGSCQRQGDGVFLPFTILQAHHPVADRYHCHLLFEDLNWVSDSPEDYL